MGKTINDLRETLFDTLEKVKKGNIDADRAKVIRDLGQTIINSAKAEIDFLKTVKGAKSTGFMSFESQDHKQIGTEEDFEEAEIEVPLEKLEDSSEKLQKEYDKELQDQKDEVQRRIDRRKVAIKKADDFAKQELKKAENINQNRKTEMLRVDSKTMVEIPAGSSEEYKQRMIEKHRNPEFIK